MIEARGLTRSFGAFVAVHPFELVLEPGRITGLLGPNGAGKTTLMRMMLGLVRPDAGTCRVGGVALVGDGKAVREGATYAPGELACYGELTAREHARWLLRGRDAGALPRALEMLGGFGLPLDQRVRGFSHGMKRILFLACALAPDLPVRVLDEPTEGLDPSRRGEVLELLRRDAAGGRTILLSSHHLGEVDAACDRMLFLREGRLLDEEYANELARRFRRALRLRFESAPDADAVRGVLAPFGEVRIASGEVSVFLETDDARPALAALAAAAELPAPASFHFGALSLGELYRELYGAEAV